MQQTEFQIISALPSAGMSKAAKKKAKQKQSMAQMLARGAGGVRVISGAGGAGARGEVAAAPALADRDLFPTLRHSSSAPSFNNEAGELGRGVCGCNAGAGFVGATAGKGVCATAARSPLPTTRQ